jgi:hypothetical protein
MALVDDLIAFWELEEASGLRVDAYGSNSLADNNTVTQAAGKVGNCAVFTQANNESLSIADNAALSMGVNQSFTIAMWVKQTSLDAGVLVGKSGGVSGNGEFEIRSVSSCFRLRTWSGAGFSGLSEVNDSADGAPTTGVWYFVVAGYDDVLDQLFISRNAGTVYTTGSVTSGAFDNDGTFALGALGNIGSGFLDGSIDQAGVWKRVLTPAEITQLYNAGAGLSYAAMTAGTMLADIAVDAVTAGGFTSFSQTPPVSIPHTCSGTNRGLLIATTHDNIDTNCSFTYAGVNVPLVVSQDIGGNTGKVLRGYYLAAPALGTNNLVATWVLHEHHAFAIMSLTGVRRSGQPEVINGTWSAPAGALSVGLTTITDKSWVVLLASAGGNLGIAAGAGTTYRVRDTEIVNQGTVGILDAGSAKTPVGAVTLEFTTINSQYLAAIALSLAPALVEGGAKRFFLVPS